MASATIRLMTLTTGAASSPLSSLRSIATAVSMGNPHAVQLVADVDAAPVATQGPLLEHHPRFPGRVNAGYMELRGRR